MSEIIQLGSYSLELYTSDNGEYRWRIKSSNGQNVASANEGFASKASCKNNIRSLLKALSLLPEEF